MFTHIDNWLLDSVFQRGADWCRDRFGITPFWLASLSTLLMIVAYLARKRFDPNTVGSSLWTLFFCGLWICMVFFFFDRKDREERTVLTRTMNPWRINPFIKFIRLSGIFFLFIDLLLFVPGMSTNIVHPLSILFKVLEDVLFCAVYYFASCNTKPPSIRPVTESKEVPEAIPETT